MNSPIEIRSLCAAVILALCAGVAPAPAAPGDAAQAKAKLADVRERIAVMTRRLGAQLQDRDVLAARLRAADLALTASRRRLEALRGAQLAAQRQQAELRAEEEEDHGALEAQQAALAAQARAAYQIGRQEQIKLLLSQASPAQAGRMLAFYGYFARERAARIEEIRERAAKLAELVDEMGEVTATLTRLQTDTAAEMAGLAQARAEHVAALGEVTSEVTSGNRELARLKEEEQAEEALVADLARVLKDFPIDSRQSFDALRGKLAWPVPGRIARSAEAHTAPAARWSGVLIDAGRGAKVRAPCFGRVVYADWLQGLGLLLIIGHGGNYMTLYGRAEVLYKSVGDAVAPGDVIAAMSDAGGAAPQLYFEIREGRRTLDPKVWLKPSP